MLAAAEGQMQTSAAEGSVTGLAGVKSAVGLILERFAAQPEAPVQLVRLMLAQERVSCCTPFLCNTDSAVHCKQSSC